MRAVKTVRTKFNPDCGGHLMEYGMAPQGYNPMVQQLGGKNPETDIFASRDEEMYKALAQGALRVVKAYGFEGVGTDVLAWCRQRDQTYGEQDHCG